MWEPPPPPAPSPPARRCTPSKPRTPVATPCPSPIPRPKPLLLHFLHPISDGITISGDWYCPPAPLQVANAGLGVAMGNAVLRVKAAAAEVVACNDTGGIAEAFERFVL